MYYQTLTITIYLISADIDIEILKIKYVIFLFNIIKFWCIFNVFIYLLLVLFC